MRLLLLVVFVVRFVTAQSQSFYRGGVSTSWTDAKSRCEGVGHSLAIIRSSQDNVAVLTACSSNLCWIGLTDSATQGTFKWVDGSPLTYENWASGEPNGGVSEDCVHMWSNGQWNDQPCTTSLQFVCERPPTSAPSSIPTSDPSSPPSSIPTSAPLTSPPSSIPTSDPSSNPSNTPTTLPSFTPTTAPSASPTTSPTFPTNAPTSAPTSGPTPFPYIEKQISPSMNGDSFGTSVAVTASHVVVGSRERLHLWRRSSGTWTAIGMIEPFDREEHPTSLFGFSVDMSGHMIVAGAPGSRSVFVYEGRHVWKQTQASQDNFGVAVSLSASTLAVGANGSVFMYTQNSQKEWQFDQELTSLKNTTDDFGRWLSLDGSSLAVGAPLDNTRQGNRSGSVYIWEKRGSRWRVSFKLIPSDLGPGDFFGRPVLLKRDFLFVGAHGKGVVYVFRWNGFLWKEQAKVTSWVGCTQLGRGSALGVDDQVSTLVVPCEHANVPNVHVFVRNGTSWVGQQIIEKNVGGFGSSLDVANDIFVVGASGNGSVFSFKKRSQTCCGC